MQELIARLREFWDNATSTNRMAVVGTALAVVVASGAMLVWARQPEFATLAADLSPADADGVVSYLKDQKVEYQLSNNGRTIAVPVAKKDELTLGLYGKGFINSGSPGWALLDKLSVGTPQEVMDQTMRRAAEGEMENAIRSIDQVSAARVTIAPGEDSVFSSVRSEPKASILVHLKSGAAVPDDSIQAIANMVAHSFKGLTLANVSMVDGKGKRLFDGAQAASGTSSSDERAAQETAFKQRLKGRIEEALLPVAGPSKYVVNVEAVLNLDRQTEDKKEPIAGAPRSKTTSTETFTGPGAAAVAKQAVGIAANARGIAPSGGTPTVAGTPESQTSGGQYNGEQSTTTYELGVNVIHTEKSPGEVKSLSVAVLLDEAVPAPTRTAITETVKTIIAAYPAPTGAWPVSVQAIAFDKSVVEASSKAEIASDAAERMDRILAYAIPLGVMLLMLFILARSLRKPGVRRSLALATGGQPMLALAGAGGAGGGLDMMIGEDGAAGMSVSEALSRGPKPIEAMSDQDRSFSVIEEAFNANLESILYLAKSKPEIVAQMVRSMIADDRR